jgi:hypothetical protein
MNKLVEKGLHDRRGDIGKWNLDPSWEAEESWLTVLNGMYNLAELN